MFVVTARDNTIDAEGNREASPDVEVQDKIQRNIWIPHCNEEIKPYKKQVFPDLDSAFEHYEDYGRECGFTVRRSTEKTNNDGKTILKYFVCSRAGPNDYSESARGNSSYKFQGCISSASGNQDHIDYIHKILKLMRNNIKMSQRKGNSRLDDESVEDLIGSKIVEGTTILPPNQSNNKGCRKRQQKNL
ncbi:hypothetical protein POM88_044859 [Heracleum sosnowskyi]|uniref:FAR1 domain-containing protein n=1 Tax=Heracleum sosnowskyi TaxID=360622 RepID=A0AAD8H695_9APIA|nr:hypothetical protein POM88_044859 [Heracleum sosnowskyi]